jgi:hypothetical protein
VELDRYVRLKISQPSVSRLSRHSVIPNISQYSSLPPPLTWKLLHFIYVDDFRTSQETLSMGLYGLLIGQLYSFIYR